VSVWISNDDRRIPLRAVAQDSGFAIRIELRDYRAGSQPRGELPSCDGIPSG
jgi:hypothetical protein